MMCQTTILGMNWYEHITNIAVAHRTNFPHIGALIYLQEDTLSSVISSAKLRMFSATCPQDVQRHVHEPSFTLSMEAPLLPGSEQGIVMGERRAQRNGSPELRGLVSS